MDTDEMTCADCKHGPRFRYPGGDPENGPAEFRCKCEIAPWEGMTDEEWEEILEADCLATGGHRYYYTRDGDGESGPMPGGRIECRNCGKEKP
jgi:hypothetical protein